MLTDTEAVAYADASCTENALDADIVSHRNYTLRSVPSSLGQSFLNFRCPPKNLNALKLYSKMDPLCSVGWERRLRLRRSNIKAARGRTVAVACRLLLLPRTVYSKK